MRELQPRQCVPRSNDRQPQNQNQLRGLLGQKAGFETEKTNWEPICCTARTQTQYETVSLGPDVHDYQVIIREPKSFSGKRP